MPGSRRPILRNITILAVGGALERILGALYRVLLARAAGPTALGLIQFCLPVLRLSLIIGTLGLPQALTRLVASALAGREAEKAQGAMLWSLRTAGLAGGGLAVSLLILMPVWRLVFPDPRVAVLFLWLAPVLFCDCLCAILQANFQGQNRMWPVALAGVLGQGGKLAASLVLIQGAVSGGAGAIAEAAMQAVAISEGCALLLLVAMTRWRRPAALTHAPLAGRGLLHSSLPLMGDGLVFAIASAIDIMIIPRRLMQAGMAGNVVTSLIGQVYGMAFPTLFLPMVILWPIAAATLPAIAAAKARSSWGEIRRRISFTYLAVGGIAIFAALCFFFCARPLVVLLYACAEAGPYLRLLSLAAVPVYLASISGTLLVGLDEPVLLFRQSLVCVILRTFLVYFLTGLPGLGIRGAVLAIIAGNALLAMANGWSIWRRVYRDDAGGKRGLTRPLSEVR